MDLSLSGCGFLSLYHLGVVSCLKEHAPQLVQNLRSVSGASAGALCGLVLLIDCPLGLVTNELMKVVKQFRSSSLGPYNPNFNITKILTSLINQFAPDNIHEIVSGRLFVSLTRLSDMQNVMISEFHSKNDLIEVNKIIQFQISLFFHFNFSIDSTFAIIPGHFSSFGVYPIN